MSKVLELLNRMNPEGGLNKPDQEDPVPPSQEQGDGNNKDIVEKTPEQIAADEEAARIKAEAENKVNDSVEGGTGEPDKGEGENNKSTLKISKEVKVDYDEFFSENKSAIQNYLEYKSFDFSKLSNEDLVRRSLKAANPTWSDKDIEDTLEYKYGVGVDTEDYTNAELKSHAEKQRNLKTAAADSLTELIKWQESLVLPEFNKTLEFDHEVETAKPLTEEELEKSALEKHAKYVEETWKPIVKGPLENYKSFSTKFNFNGQEVDLEVVLDDEDKANIANFVNDWVAHPSDENYLDANQNPDVDRFVRERTQGIILQKVVNAAVVKATELTKEAILKKQINFVDQTTPHITPPGKTDESDGLAVLKHFAKARANR